MFIEYRDLLTCYNILILLNNGYKIVFKKIIQLQYNNTTVRYSFKVIFINQFKVFILFQLIFFLRIFNGSVQFYGLLLIFFERFLLLYIIYLFNFSFLKKKIAIITQKIYTGMAYSFNNINAYHLFLVVGLKNYFNDIKQWSVIIV